jgi:hypothetical protein
VYGREPVGDDDAPPAITWVTAWVVVEGGSELLLGAVLACEHGESPVECFARYVVALRPTLPGREGA